jgi:response regulator RpfG family c-di-GMP phosphodiesterase
MNEEKKPARILVVDDEDRNRRLLVAMLEAEGYSASEAANGAQALEFARQNPPDIVLLDIMMPGMDGYDVARALKADAATKAIPVVMVTALDDRESRLRGLEAGGEEFVTKPVDRDELRIRVRNLLRLKEFSDFLVRHNEILKAQVDERTVELKIAFMSTVEVATTLSEMRDPYTAGHERRVAKIAAAIGAEIGLDERQQEGLRVAGQLHDIGKINIPSEILSKPGKLTAIEYQLIKGHAQAGYDVLKGVEFPWPLAQVALQHHERIDGSGYPQGLKGEAILFEARIMSVADVVEAMSSHRPYRPGLGIDKALAEIERGRGTAYDSQAADACLRLFREKGYQLPA